MTEVLTTNGSSEGLYASVMGLVDPGDEVLYFCILIDNFVYHVKLFCLLRL